MVAYAKKAKEPPRLTPQEYLEWERKADVKSEYDGGVVTAMASASWPHNVIAENVRSELRAQLRRQGCVVVGSDLRVRVSECDKYYYPDAVIVCEPPQFEDSELDTLLNPTVIVEVLSDSTASKDLGEKWDCYQTLKSLDAYILVSSDKPSVAIFRRQDNGWFYWSVTGLEASLSIGVIGSELRLTDVYDQIAFKKTPDTQSDEESTGAP